MRKVSMARAIARMLGFMTYLVVTSSVIVFLVIEMHPAILEFIGPERIPYYAKKHLYVPDDELAFTKRPSIYNEITGRDRSYVFGDQTGGGAGNFTSLIKPWRYSASPIGTDLESPSDEDVAIIGDSFVEIGEAGRSQLGDLVASDAGLRVATVASSGYGPDQYALITERLLQTSSIKTIVLVVFAGNDAWDIHRFQSWKETGIHSIVRHQTDSIFVRYFVAMRDVLMFVAGRSAAMIRSNVPDGGTGLARRVASGLEAFAEPAPEKPSPLDRIEPYENFMQWNIVAGGVRLANADVPMLFSYWPPQLSAQEQADLPSWRRFGEIVKTLEALKSGRDLRIVWVLVPTKLQVYAGLAGVSDLGDPSFRSKLAGAMPYIDNFQESFRLLTQGMKIDVLDLLPVFRKQASRCLLYYPGDSHWSEDGRMIAAGALASHLSGKSQNAVDPACADYRESYAIVLPVRSPEALDRFQRLQAGQFSTFADFERSARMNGLVPSARIEGYVDLWKQRDKSLQIGGWARDHEGDGSPLSVISYLNARSIAPARTFLPRDDVMPDPTSPNTKSLGFETSAQAGVDCMGTSSFFAVAVSDDGRYAQLPVWGNTAQSCAPK